MKNILIAGGSGLIGAQLTHALRAKGHSVSILSRNPKGKDQYAWDPKAGTIDESILANVEVLINLSGAGIADKKWTAERKQELHASRIGTNVFLYSLVDKMPRLQQYVCSSGINCYGYLDNEKVYTEDDPFGKDYLSQLVKVWELSADQFKSHCKVAKIRTAMVLDANGGALKKMLPVINMGIGSAIASGKQFSPWIHSEDLARLFVHTVEQQLEGSYNALAGSVSNKELMRTIAKTLKKPFFFPKVPSFIIRILYGEMSLILLYGLKASNEKICSTGFEFKFKDLSAALKDVLVK
jgi:uncharacterized protein (TIGR01777 family)